MTSGRSYLQGSFGLLVTKDFGHIGLVCAGLVRPLLAHAQPAPPPLLYALPRSTAGDDRDRLSQGRDPQHADEANGGGRRKTFERGDQPFHADAGRRLGHRQHPPSGPDDPIQGHLPHRPHASDRLERELSAGGQRGQGYGEIEAGAVLGNIAGAEIDRDAARGQRDSAGCRSRPDPLARLAHRRSRKTDDSHSRKSGPRVSLHAHRHRLDAYQGEPPDDRDAHA